VYAFAASSAASSRRRSRWSWPRHYVGTVPAITRTRIAIHEYPWAPISANGPLLRAGRAVHPDRHLDHRRRAREQRRRGIADLVVLNTTGSEFWGFPRDEVHDPGDAHDRMLATTVSAQWRLREPAADWAAIFEAARLALLDAFTQPSKSLQQTLFGMGSAILGAVPGICEVRLALPNKHHFVVDMGAFGIANENEVYYAADRPYGLTRERCSPTTRRNAGIAWT